MKQSIKRAGLTAVATAALTITLAGPALAAPQSWHLKNSIDSDGLINAYGLSSCNTSGGVTDLSRGESLTSHSWDGVRVFGRRFSVKVYDDKDGHKITTKHYDASDCATIGPNDYAVVAGSWV